MNNVTALRTKLGWSMEALGEKIGASTSTINRIEKGETELVSDWVFKLAAVFDVSEAEVLGWANSAIYALKADAELFHAPAEHALARADLGPDRTLLTVVSDSLDALGIRKGDVAIVDTGKAALASVQSLDVVWLELVDDVEAARGGDPRIFLRQFVEPDLFITNARFDNREPINRMVQPVRIKGKIEHAVSPLRR